MWIWSCPVILVYFSFENNHWGKCQKDFFPIECFIQKQPSFISLQHSTAKIGLSEQHCPKYCRSVLCNKLRNTWHGDQACQSTTCFAVHIPFFLTEAAARKWDQIPSCVSTVQGVVCVVVVVVGGGGAGSMMHALKCPAGTHMHTNVHMVMQNLIEKSCEFVWSSCYTHE